MAGVEILYVKSRLGKQYSISSLEPKIHYKMPNPPPTSPRRGKLNKFTMPKPYDFGSPTKFNYEEAATLYADLVARGKRPIPLLFPVAKDLAKLDVWEEIRSSIVNSGMDFVFRDDPGTYDDMTMEFISSFVPIHGPCSDDSDGKLMGWRFALGNYQWEVKGSVLYDWLGLPRDGEIPEIVEEDIMRFWKRISGCEYKKVGQHTSTSIWVPKWSFIHKLLAGTVFVRSDRGRLVSRMEMAIMLMMEKGEKIDWLWCITNGIEGYQSLTSQNRGLGGGSFVTWIAKRLNFTFESKESNKMKLDVKKLQYMRLLGKGLKWTNDGERAEAVVEEEPRIDDEFTGLPSSSRNQPPPPPFADSSFASLSSRFDSLVSYTSQHNQWTERTLFAITDHLGIYSTITPPPRFPFAPHSPHPPSSPWDSQP